MPYCDYINRKNINFISILRDKYKNIFISKFIIFYKSKIKLSYIQDYKKT